MRFQSGTSPNPAGRPVGTGDQRRRLVKLIEPHIHQLTEQRLAAAIKGDASAADAILCLYARLK